MSDIVPRPGDRVRVTYEGTYLRPHPKEDGCHIVRVPDDSNTRVTIRSASVEVLERADDPANATIGAIWQHDDTSIVVKVDDDKWVSVPGAVEFIDIDLRTGEWRPVDAMPFTPAWERQQAEVEHTDSFPPEPPLHTDNAAIVQGQYRPAGLSLEVQQSVAELLVAGDEVAAIRAVQASRCGMTTGEARAVVREMPEYRTGLNLRQVTEVELSTPEVSS